jgi:hypothetical protein
LDIFQGLGIAQKKEFNRIAEEELLKKRKEKEASDARMAITRRIILNGYAWTDDVLKKYSNEVEKGFYSKIDYKTWRALSGGIKGDYRILISIEDKVSYTGISIGIFDANLKLQNHFEFASVQHFGSFILSEWEALKEIDLAPWFGDKELKKMLTDLKQAEDKEKENKGKLPDCDSAWKSGNIQAVPVAGEEKLPKEKYDKISADALKAATIKADSSGVWKKAFMGKWVSDDWDTPSSEEVDIAKPAKAWDMSIPIGSDEVVSVKSDGSVFVSPSRTSVPVKSDGSTLTSTASVIKFDDTSGCSQSITFKNNGSISIDPIYATTDASSALSSVTERCMNCKNFDDKNNEKEKSFMDFNFDFGKVDTSKVRLSPYGITIKNKDGKWVSFDAKNNQVIDVDMFNFDMEGLLWKIPVAVSAVQAGDVIVHNHKPMYVISTNDGLWVADIFEGEQKRVMPLTNMFQFNFVTKVVSLMNFGQGANAPSEDNPFGANFMPMLFMSEFMKDKDKVDDKDDMTKMLMMSMMMGGGQNPFANLFNFGNQTQNQ